MTMSRSFVNAQGYLSRRPPLLPTYSKRRIVLVISTLLLLILTNPANGTRSWLPNSLWTNVRYFERPGSTTRASWFYSKPKSTNFIILALTRDHNHITATGLLRTFELCSMGSTDPITKGVCTWIGDTFCHGKPVLDSTDLPYTLTRLLSLALMTSMILSYCSYREPTIVRLPPALSWFEGADSILRHSTWYDVVRVQTCVYPALLSMKRMVSTMVYEQVKVDIHIILGCTILIVFIGTVGNRLGTKFTKVYRVTGLDASIGACLAYQRIIGSTLVLFHHDRVDVSILHFFWCTVVTYLLDNRVGQLVSFLTGAMLGNFFAVLQKQVILETLLVRMEVGWRRFLDYFLFP